MLNFNDCAVLVDGSGILATSAQISTQNNLEPNYAVGYRGSAKNSPDGPISTTITVTFLAGLAKDANLANLNNIKNITNELSYDGVDIVIGNITGSNCFLTNLSFNVSPNTPIVAQASYTTWEPLTGDFATKPSNYSYDTSVIGHAWSTHFVTGGSTRKNILNFEYKASFNWNPIFVIGQKTPADVSFLGGSEEFNIIEESFSQPQFSGQSIESIFGLTTDTAIDLQKLTFICDGDTTNQMVFEMSGAKMVNSNIAAQINNIVIDSLTFIKNF